MTGGTEAPAARQGRPSRRWWPWLLTALCTLVALPIFLVVAAFPPSGDPLAALPRGGTAAAAVETQSLREGGRVIRQYEMADPVLGKIGFVVSLPETLPARPMPVIVVLGGLGTGLKNIRQIGRAHV